MYCPWATCNRADSKPERADFRPERADFRPERTVFRPERAWGGQTNGRMDGQTNKSPLCSTGLRPLWGRCTASHSDLQPCKAGQWVLLTMYCLWATCKRADSRPERADFSPERADFSPERADFKPERAWGGQTNKRINGRTNKRT